MALFISVACSKNIETAHDYCELHIGEQPVIFILVLGLK